MPAYSYETKTGKRWMYKCSIRGRQILRRGFRTRREALAAEAALLSGGKEEGKKVPLLSEAVADFLRIRSSQAKPSTLRAMEGKLRIYVLGRMPDLPVDRYSYAMLSEWWEGVKACPLKGRNYVLGLLKAVFRHAGTYFGVTNAEVLKLLPQRDFSVRRKAERSFLTLDSFLRILEAEKDPFFRLYLVLSFVTGMRISEARGLQGKCIEGRTLSVFQQVQSKTGQGNVLTTPKTRSSVRTFLLPEFLAKALSEHVRANGIGPESFVFFARSGKDAGHLRPISENTINRELRRLSTVTGIVFTSHSLRHGEATLLASLGLSAEEVGRYLGHSSVEVTRATYIHETQEERERISALLEGVLGKSFPG